MVQFKPAIKYCCREIIAIQTILKEQKRYNDIRFQFLYGAIQSVSVWFDSDSLSSFNAYMVRVKR